MKFVERALSAALLRWRNKNESDHLANADPVMHVVPADSVRNCWDYATDGALLEFVVADSSKRCPTRCQEFLTDLSGDDTIDFPDRSGDSPLATFSRSFGIRVRLINQTRNFETDLCRSND